jgi:hypothetical protein
MLSVSRGLRAELLEMEEEEGGAGAAAAPQQPQHPHQRVLQTPQSLLARATVAVHQPRGKADWCIRMLTLDEAARRFGLPRTVMVQFEQRMTTLEWKERGGRYMVDPQHSIPFAHALQLTLERKGGGLLTVLPGRARQQKTWGVAEVKAAVVARAALALRDPTVRALHVRLAMATAEEEMAATERRNAEREREEREPQPKKKRQRGGKKEVERRVAPRWVWAAERCLAHVQEREESLKRALAGHDASSGEGPHDGRWLLPLNEGVRRLLCARRTAVLRHNEEAVRVGLAPLFPIPSLK